MLCRPHPASTVELARRTTRHWRALHRADEEHSGECVTTNVNNTRSIVLDRAMGTVILTLNRSSSTCILICRCWFLSDTILFFTCATVNRCRQTFALLSFSVYIYRSGRE